MAHSTAGVLVSQTEALSKSKIFTIAAHAARVILGIIFLVFGINGFFQFIPMPPPTGTAAEFIYGLVKGQYLMPLVAFIQVIGGVLLLSGSLVPLGLLLLFPISLNILFFHLAIAPQGTGMAVFIMAAIILLAVYYWPVYKPIFGTANAWKSRKT